MNILDFYKYVEAEAVATQLAVLEIVTYTNAIGTGLKQTKEKADQAWRWLSGKLSSNHPLEARHAKNLTEQVVQRAESYAQIPKGELTRRVFAELGRRLDCSPHDIELLSAFLIREAATGLNVDENLLLGQQAEEVTRRYWKSVLEQIKEHLKKQSPQEAVKMERLIQDRLSAMTPFERLELQKALNLPDLSGNALRGAFMQAGGPLAGIAAVNMLGFGAYIALSIIIHAIFTTMLGITLPFAFYTGASSLLSLLTGPLGVAIAVAAGIMGWAFGQIKLNRSQYAMIVWACVTHMDRALYTPTNQLPSMRPSYLLGERKVIGAVVCAVSADSDHELSARAAEREGAQSCHSVAHSELRSDRKEFEQLESRLEKTEAELRAARIRTADTSSGLERKASTITLLETEISRLASESRALSNKVKDAEAKAEVAHARLCAAEQKYEAKVESRRAEIEKLWKVHFPTFSFASKPLRWVAEKTFNERLEVERALVELRDAANPIAMSRGKMAGTDQHHCAFKLSPKVPARIFYRRNVRGIEITQY
jgi:hypothetical protein